MNGLQTDMFKLSRFRKEPFFTLQFVGHASTLAPYSQPGNLSLGMRLCGQCWSGDETPTRFRLILQSRHRCTW